MVSSSTGSHLTPSMIFVMTFGRETASSPHAQRRVFFRLFEKARAQMTRRDEFPVAAEKGRIVHAENHGNRRLVDGDRGQRFGIFRVADRVRNVEIFDADDAADVSAGDAGTVFPPQALEREKLLYLRRLHRAVALDDDSRRKPSNVKSCFICAGFIVPSRLTTTTGRDSSAVPRKTRPMPMRPT